MHRSLQAVLVAGLITLAASTASGRSRDFVGGGPILHDITVVDVEVGAPEELTGVERSVRDALETALERAGLIIDRGSGVRPLPDFRVRIVAVADQDRFFYTILTKVTLGPDWSDPEAFPAPHLLWEAPPMVGIVRSDQFDVLTSRAIHVADQFLRSWEADKERANAPDPDESDRLEYDLYADD